MVSIETKFAEACDQLRQVGKYKLFNERRAALKTSAVEPQLNLAMDVLVAGKITESTTPITKHNGSADNQLFSEADGGNITEVAAKNKAAIKGFTCMGISESDARRTLKLPPAEVEAKGHKAITEWLLAHAR